VLNAAGTAVCGCAVARARKKQRRACLWLLKTPPLAREAESLHAAAHSRLSDDPPRPASAQRARASVAHPALTAAFHLAVYLTASNRPPDRTDSPNGSPARIPKALQRYNSARGAPQTAPFVASKRHVAWRAGGSVRGSRAGPKEGGTPAPPYSETRQRERHTSVTLQAHDVAVYCKPRHAHGARSPPPPTPTALAQPSSRAALLAYTARYFYKHAAACPWQPWLPLPAASQGCTPPAQLRSQGPFTARRRRRRRPRPQPPRAPLPRRDDPRRLLQARSCRQLRL
jgi:hypothetical protein